MGKKLVVGIGNLLLKDEGVGVHVIRALEKRALPPDVELIDGGTAGADLLPYLSGAEKIIIVDALMGGGEPGAIYCLTPDDCEPQEEGVSISLHDLGVLVVLKDLELLEGRKTPVLIIGIEPKELGWGMELTPEVAASLPRVIELIEREIT
ncbi:MAG TPA: hydrogenase maturation protease [Syntrophomonadaceae bacterium]|nr:hydrogenase maturation protease [Syntrophomonadaceae bacterium]